MNKPIKLVYIAGSNRSGTTLLDRMLGQVPGFFSVGELLPSLDKFLTGQTLCGCGKPGRVCSFWGQVIDPFLSKFSIDDVRQFLADTRPSLLSKRSKWSCLPSSRRNHLREKYSTMLFSLYSLIRDVSGANVLVDSSKGPWFLDALFGTPDIDLHLIHVVRDPRAVAYSWSRKKAEIVPGQYMERRPALKVSAAWLTTNLRIEMIKRRQDIEYSFFRYEDLATNPLAVLSAYFSRYAPSYVSVLSQYLSTDGVNLRTNHTAGGNPMRGVSGVISVRPDVEWQTSLSWPKRWLITSIGWPLMVKYQYIFTKKDAIEEIDWYQGKRSPLPKERGG